MNNDIINKLNNEIKYVDENIINDLYKEELDRTIYQIVNNQYYDFLFEFLDRFSDIIDYDIRHNCFLYLSSKRKIYIIEKFIKKYKININYIDKNGNSAIHKSIPFHGDDYSFTLKLLKMGININLNKDGDTALHRYFSVAQYDAVKFLLENGADPYITLNGRSIFNKLDSMSSIHGVVRMRKLLNKDR